MWLMKCVRQVSKKIKKSTMRTCKVQNFVLCFNEAKQEVALHCLLYIPNCIGSYIYIFIIYLVYAPIVFPVEQHD